MNLGNNLLRIAARVAARHSRGTSIHLVSEQSTATGLRFTPNLNDTMELNPEFLSAMGL